MRRGPSWLRISVVLGVIAAVVVVSPAIGGPSLRSLVKQEVAKQLASSAKKKSKRGPAGPQGPPGTNGTNGANGTPSNVYFAKVTYTTSTTSIASGSPGITGGTELSMGSPRVFFPRDMTSCSITATPFTASSLVIRVSDSSSGQTVILRTLDSAFANARGSFDLVAVCP